MSFNVGDILDGKVVRVKPYGAFVDIGAEKAGMVHISEVAQGYVKDIGELIKEGDTVHVKIIAVTEQGISLSIRAALPQQERPRETAPAASRGTSRQPRSTGDKFEDMMNQFKRDSDDKMYELRRTIDTRRGGQNRRANKK